LKILRSAQEVKEATIMAYKKVPGKGLQEYFLLVVLLLAEMCDSRQELLQRWCAVKPAMITDKQV
jgi:hypothetical protein